MREYKNAGGGGTDYSTLKLDKAGPLNKSAAVVHLVNAKGSMDIQLNNEQVVDLIEQLQCLINPTAAPKPVMISGTSFCKGE